MSSGKSRLFPSIGLLVLIAIGCSLQAPSAKSLASKSSATVFQPAATEAYGGILIAGSPEFVEQTRQALALLRSKAAEAYVRVQAYVGVIAEGHHSGMWAWENPPRCEVGDPTAFYSITWYASTIAHDATHSELYHTDQEWEGVAVERLCNSYQLTVLEQIGAPRNEIDYLAGLDGTHCDVDGDGDCDWADYQNRNW